MNVSARLNTDSASDAIKNGVIFSEEGITALIQVTRRHVDTPDDEEPKVHRMVILSLGDFLDIRVPFEGPLAEVDTLDAALAIAVERGTAYLRSLPDRLAPVFDHLIAAVKAGVR